MVTRSSIAPVTTVRVVLAGAGSEQPKRAETDHRNTGCDICTATVAVHQHMEMHYITAEHRVVQLIIARAAGTGGGKGGCPTPIKVSGGPPQTL